MGISSSLYSSISGLSTLGNSMSVIGDNVSNVNTVAFKASRATFQDVLSQQVSTAAGSSQIGRGVTLSAVDGIFAQGSFESSSTPTDMAIGGDGFFMLRAATSAEADNYSRAGEFRFDKDGNLINPSGYFVQGWTLDTTTGERQGTIGDINLGKSTPPVSTTHVDAIVNVDSRKKNEATEVRLFDAWDGRNAAAVNPTPPIDSTNYEYSSALKVYDSVGASHDITIYFDRTTKDNQWEFLVSCDPTEDLRALSAADQAIYTPDTRYNYQNHKGAGALMYGVMDFSTSGDITNIDCYKVPPDAEVDPALNDNRITLNPADNFYTFPVNFTGDLTNSAVELSFGARYSGQSNPMTQILVSDKGAFSDATAATPITSDTTWDSVYDANGNVIANGDQFVFNGFTHDGTAAATLTYTVATASTTKVQDLLTQLETTFGGSASIDASGRIRLTDNQGGDSGMYVSSFTTTAASGADPFGSQINVTTSKEKILSTARGLTTAGGVPPVINANTDWGSVYTSGGAGPVAAGNTFIFNGTKPDGTAVAAATFTVNAVMSPNNNVQDLLDWLETTFDAEAVVDNAGRLVMTDRTADSSTYSSALSVTSVAGTAPAIFGAAAFATIPSDANEDGSRAGDIVTTAFDPEALASTQYANSSTTIFQDQDGYAAGFLQSVSVDTEGVITGHYSNGQVLKKAQVALATFNNLAGLFKEGGNIFRETSESGAPITGAPGTNGLGSIAPNSLEQSNVDIGNEFVKLITTQRGFQANSKIISTTDQMLADLINIKR